MADYQGKRQKNTSPDLFTTLLSLVGNAVWSLVTLPFRNRSRIVLDRPDYQMHWERIVGLIGHQDNELHWKQAVMEADKLMDRSLQDVRALGTSFGERLRRIERRFSPDTYQAIWEAHKLRNNLAHEVGFSVSKNQYQTALKGFERGLRALGAL